MRFQDCLDRFLFGRIDERACIDDEHIGFVRAGGDFHTVLQNTPQHDLRVDEILGAAKADHSDLCAV